MEYRVRRTELPLGEFLFDFCEVATTDDGSPLDVSCDSFSPTASSVEELGEILKLLSEAISKPQVDDKIVLEEWNVEGALDEEDDEEFKDRMDWEKMYNSVDSRIEEK